MVHGWMGEPTEVKQKQIMLSVEECEILFCSSKNAPFISKYRFSLTFSKLSFYFFRWFSESVQVSGK